MPVPVKVVMTFALAAISLGIGFLAGRCQTPPASPSPVHAPAASPASPDAPRLQAELSQAQAELRDARLKADLLQKEIAEQDGRRQGLEHHFRELEASSRTSSREVPSTPSFETDLAAFSRKEALAEKALTRSLLGSPEAQDAFVRIWEKATTYEAVRLWDIAFGTYLSKEGLNGKTMSKMPRLREGLEALLPREQDPGKRKMMEGLVRRD